MGEDCLPTDHSINTKAEGINRIKHSEKSQLSQSENLALFYSPLHMTGFFSPHICT